MKKLILFVLIIAFAASCKDEDNTLYMTVSPVDFAQYVDSSQIIHFVVNAETSNKDRSLNRFKMSYTTKTEGTKVLFDSIINNTQKFSYEVDYRIPVFSDSTDIYITFDIYDNEGNTFKVSRLLIVKTYDESEALLSEFAGNVIYSDPNYHGTAFNLLSCTLLSKDYTDSTQMDILADFDTINPTILPLKWTSPTQLKFVRFNGLDYANVTSKSAKAAYDGGTKNDFISSITANDIYITKLTSGVDIKYIVIKVTNVFDNTGSENDMYMFNVKK